MKENPQIILWIKFSWKNMLPT